MKHKITRRLVCYFSAVLLLFSVVASVLFLILSTHHAAVLHEQELKIRAVSIADTLSGFRTPRGRGPGMGGGYGAYLRFIDQIAMSEVWIVDDQARTIQMGHMGDSLSYDTLPTGAEALVKEALQGEVKANQAFNALLKEPSVTVAAPILDQEGTVQAVLLLHSPINGLERVQRDSALILLFCIVSGLLLAGIFAVRLAGRFIKPLAQMETATTQLIQGNYSVRTGVQQADEIGSLAKNIDELTLRLSDAAQEQKKLDQMRQDFVSNISHELRTPVTVLKGSLEVLNEGLVTDPREIQSYFQQMLADTTHLQRLVNDLLELSRLQNTDFQIEKSELNLADVVTDAVRSIQRLAGPKQVEVRLANPVPAFRFSGDYGRLRQMLLVVLDNAVKFSPSPGTVEVEAQVSATGYRVSVQDHGQGISPEDAAHIFDRFYGKRTRQNSTGTGLGLPIAKQIGERHDVRIICESSPEHGACFTFLFPQPNSSQK